MRIPDNYVKSLEKFYLEEKRVQAGLFPLDSPAYYGHGYFLDKLSERDLEIIGLISDLNENKLQIEKFRNFIANLEREKKAKEMKYLVESISDCQKSERMEDMPRIDLEPILAYLENLDFDKFSENCKSIYISLYSHGTNFNFTSDEYVALCALQLMCQFHFQLTKRFLVPDDNSLGHLRKSENFSHRFSVCAVSCVKS
ncbi:MAG: hypothetical protein Q7V56_06540 [Gammaproteobacteria bacterium]|nr:hypothetical protein [Gammaproteobacteria bacterium]